MHKFKNLFILNLFILFAIAGCELASSGEDDKNPDPYYVGDIEIVNVRTTRLDEFNFTLEWDIVDGEGKEVKEEHAEYREHVRFADGSGHAGSGDGLSYTPNINLNSGHQVTNLTVLCGQKVEVDLEVFVPGKDNSTLTDEVSYTVYPPDCDYRFWLERTGAYDGWPDKSRDCKNWNSYTFYAENLTYKGWAPFMDFVKLFDDDPEEGVCYSRLGSVEINVDEARVRSQTTNYLFVRSGPELNCPPRNGIKVIGPVVEKQNCEAAAAYELSMDVWLEAKHSGDVLGKVSINEVYTF